MITKILYYILVLPISFLPYLVLLLISEIIYLIIYKVIGYRKNIVFNNLKNSFPKKTNQELEQIMSDFYHHLCDLIVETIKMLNASKSFINEFE